MDPQHQQQATQYYALPDKPQQFGGYQQPPVDQQHLPAAFVPEKAPAAATTAGPTILSIKRSTALIFLGILSLFFLLVIGLAAGLGVSQKNLSQTQSDLQLAQAAISAVTAAAATTSLLATPTKTSSPTSTASPKSDVQCPRINQTIYTVSASASNGTAPKQFKLLCGFDYGKGEAVDIGNTKVKNLNACADACAARSNCTGAGWGVIEGDKGVEHTCWMKNNLTTPHNATAEWGFAVLIGANDTATGGDDGS
ncbi:hypothetical protein QBC47DRAFT_450316 [Echria macrotheca]|uniref:Apple domain-containing protein n=1 Tax=Echria macrotheca TaxID=438768 RepID=A0AAJ0F9A0_9PEZI|nr:hypothetical protein QBC47DRAFT_450316 [Echria macrotheca]